MITPFRDGNIDYNAVEQIVKYYADSGCAGIFAVCQSSEMNYLSLEERINLAKAVTDYAENYAGGRMNVVAGGHISASLKDQAYEINRLAESGADIIVLVTNRLDIYNQGDDAWLKNMERLLSAVDSSISLGLYECPTPYKRLLSRRLIDWCVKSGRFSFFKGTCCDQNVLAERIEQTRNSNMMVFNANGQTLYQSLLCGAAGYSGILANFIPEMLVWLNSNINDPDAEFISELISMIAHTENDEYPVTGKYSLSLSGINITLESRKNNCSFLSDYRKEVIKQIYSLNRRFTDCFLRSGAQHGIGRFIGEHIERRYA